MNKPSLNPADIDLLKTVFATKDDLQAFATKDDVRGIVKTELQPIRKELKSIKKDTSDLVDFLDKDLMKISRRVKRLENHSDLPPLVGD